MVKSPQFSFARLSGADPILQVEMSSTGEVAAFGDSYDEALLKSIMSSSRLVLENKTALLSLGGQVNKENFCPLRECFSTPLQTVRYRFHGRVFLRQKSAAKW